MNLDLPDDLLWSDELPNRLRNNERRQPTSNVGLPRKLGEDAGGRIGKGFLDLVQ